MIQSLTPYELCRRIFESTRVLRLHIVMKIFVATIKPATHVQFCLSVPPEETEEEKTLPNQKHAERDMLRSSTAIAHKQNKIYKLEYTFRIKTRNGHTTVYAILRATILMVNGLLNDRCIAICGYSLTALRTLHSC